MKTQLTANIDGICSMCLRVVAVFTLGATGCAGPVALSIAIDPQDETAYVAALNDMNMDARTAFADWMAAERHETPADILLSDVQFSQTRNPFDAYRDDTAVSRGAVLYKIHCARCHGEDARGRGPSILEDHPAKDFKSFGKRFAATLHRGAPRKWFRVIRDGNGDFVDYPEGRQKAMPAFGEQFTREQIWLVITYLQSLDVHAPKQSNRS